MCMKTKAVYEDGVLKPIKKLDLPERTKVRVVIRKSFSKLLDEVGEVEAKKNVDKILENIKARNYYE